ncbi:hypothetical protein PVMG_04573 [Plasmodium vivax Mauritania I]|uniref:Uncharacterized protein n=1 Tax=Plasmodium vivax Mauritania I TaxID=1035515 RepID=A0A0J9VQU9_PLAVI|nr:hypothetical protein PVMG_04573 [Plasmodium vivax Mauritania I]
MYSLLKDIWTTYDAFDKDVENDTNRNKYISVCRYFIDPLNEEKEQHEKFCTKLIRNLGHYSDKPESYKFTPMKCNNLNNWAYNSMKKYSIPEKILTSCFDDYKFIVERRKQTPNCFYYEYDKTYKEPMKIIMLNIFESNIHIIKNILEGEIDSVHCSCQKFIENIVNIYKHMKNNYCSNDIVGINPKTCQQLTSFAGSYQYLYNYATIRDKIPSLEYEKHVNIHGCESDNSHQGRSHTEIHPKQKPVESPRAPQLNENNDSNNPISPTASTALGTVAGASSLLALLYKVNANIHLNMKTIIYNCFYTAIIH